MTELFLESEFQHKRNEQTKNASSQSDTAIFSEAIDAEKNYSNTKQERTKNKIEQNCHRQDRNLPLRVNWYIFKFHFASILSRGQLL